MSTELILARLRRWLLWLSGGLCLGTVIELWLTEHTEGIQFLPFVLCSLGLLAVAGALVRPQKFTLWSLRAVMGLMALGSGLGIYEHLESNAGFYLEIHPNASTAAVLGGAFTGANPLMAPGILALAAVLAWAATYQHPRLQN